MYNPMTVPLVIKGKKLSIRLFQGGMGVGVSRWRLAAAVAREGGVGVISTAGLDRLVSRDIGRKVNTYEAVFWEVSKAKSESNNGLIGVNVMDFLKQDRDQAIIAAIDAGADFVICGAGLPLNLPAIKNPGNTALIPIISSERALKIIFESWKKYGYCLDAVIVEGPLAGGHLGFKFEELNNPENKLENLIVLIKAFAIKNGDFPVIAAGGIFNYGDAKNIIDLGADGVQIGSRYLATVESHAPEKYKQAIVNCQAGDIIVTKNSPCGFPFRVIKQSPMYQELLKGNSHNVCDKGYLLQKDENGNYVNCRAKKYPKDYFDICNGLLNAYGYSGGPELWTAGDRAIEITEISTVKKVTNSIIGIED